MHVQDVLSVTACHLAHDAANGVQDGPGVLRFLAVRLARARCEVEGIEPLADTGMCVEVPLWYAAHDVWPDLVDASHLCELFEPVVTVDAVDIIGRVHSLQKAPEFDRVCHRPVDVLVSDTKHTSASSRT